MNYVTINERAAAQAIDFAVGPEVRVGIERLYELLNKAEQAAWNEGFDAGTASVDRVNEAEKRAQWSEGYDEGYEAAKEGDDNGFYDASEMDEKAEADEVYYAGDNPDDEETSNETSDDTGWCHCEQCSVERAEFDATRYFNPAVSPMQEKTNSFAWSPGPALPQRLT